MAYEKQGFKDDEVLYARQLNHIEDYLSEVSKEKLDKQLGAENALRLLYVDPDGVVQPLMLGAGLAIVNGALTIMGAVEPDEPDEPVEAIQLVEQPDGTLLVQGVAFVEQADGSVLWSGAAFAEQADGGVLVG